MEPLLVLVGLYLLVAPALGVWALFRLSRQRKELEELRGQVAALAETAAEHGGEAEPEATPVSETRAASQAEEPPEPAPAPTETPTTAPPGRRLGGLEESLASRWLVWLGGLTLALGGAFLFKYSIDQGWLGPAVRVLLGCLFGLLLIVAGEGLRRRPFQREIARRGPDYVPPALTAAGLSIGFVSVYAAFALYGLIGPLLAFVGLAALAAAAIALSLLQGPFIALLGLLGGFATPALVGSEDPTPWGLFGYLLALIAPSLILVRARDWRWLAWAALAGAAFWPLVWIATAWQPGDAWPLGGYLIGLAVLFLGLRPKTADDLAEGEGRWPWSRPIVERVTWAAALATVVLAFLLFHADGSGTVSLAAAAVLAVLLLAFAFQDHEFDGLAILAALLALSLVATWRVPRDITAIPLLYRIEGREYGLAPGPMLPPELMPLALWAALFALLFGLGCYAAIGRARRPALWAAVSALMPVLLLALVYWRVAHLGLDLKWALVALLVAALGVAAAAQVRRFLGADRQDLVIGLYALAVIAAIGLGATMALKQAWLTVALSLQMPALAWLHARSGVRFIRQVALLLASVILVRLLLNPYVLDYPLGSAPAFNWILYGYGLPAVAFWIAALRFRRSGDDLLVKVLAAGTIGFVFYLITLEIRSLFAGSLTAPRYAFAEMSLQSIAWLSLALALAWLERAGPGPVFHWGARILALLAAAQVLLLQVGFFNPLWTGEAVGAWPFANWLLLAYALPAVFAFAFVTPLRQAGEVRPAAAAGLLGFALAFVYLSMEVRHLFQGPDLSAPQVEDAELYTYSAAWLAYAGLLLALGILRNSAPLRYASLAILLITVAKVFLVDLAGLTGLFRVASFLGLGLCLVGIGFLYQRFVFPPRPPRSEPETAAGVTR
ncbi:MAG: DUF2339 domain-containing protein [Kiloniellales bacterium]|nr:DUF2339 domain-containing protein [Kiloniellales bacterium]